MEQKATDVASESSKVCPICEKELPPTMNLSFHMMLHPSQKHFACDFCLQTFETRDEVANHIKLDHISQGTHSCEECGKLFRSGGNLNRHKYMRHSNIIKYTCIYCDLQFKEHGQYRIHESSHDTVTDYQCEACSVYFVSRKNLQLHVTQGDCESKVLTCCEKTFMSRMDYVQHILAFHKKHKKASVKCQYCGKALAYRYLKKVHERECGYKPLDSPRIIKTDQEGNPLQHSCNQCNRTFSSRQGLLIHLHSHLKLEQDDGKSSEDKPSEDKLSKVNFECPICGKRLSDRSSLHLHKTRHTNPVRFHCKVCNKGFFSRASMNSHEAFHTKEKKFKCNYCPKAFPYKTSMIAHQRIHTGERPYKCRFCDMTFTRCNIKQSHERVHTGEKPFTCRICSKSFGQDSTWRQHERTHGDIECDHCGCQFTTRKDLKGHVCSKHRHIDDYVQTDNKVVEETVQSYVGDEQVQIVTIEDVAVYLYE